MNLILERRGRFPLFTLGLWTLGTKTWCNVARPWLNNQPMVSCIPVGTYGLAPAIHHWPAHPGIPQREPTPTYEILNVPNRTGIHIHPFNWMDESEGCEGVGMGWQVRATDNVIGVAASAVAFNQWYALMQQLQPTQIVIT